MRPADTWKDYELLDATGGNRLERWGETLLVRPDPQVVWKTPQQSPGPRQTPSTTAPIRAAASGSTAAVCPKNGKFPAAKGRTS